MGPLHIGNIGLSRPGKLISRPNTVAWNELFELQHEVFTHDLIHLIIYNM